jgi:hypothetical protein
VKRESQRVLAARPQALSLLRIVRPGDSPARFGRHHRQPRAGRRVVPPLAGVGRWRRARPGGRAARTAAAGPPPTDESPGFAGNLPLLG